MEITYGTATKVATGIRRLTCNNPSPLTGPGTNTYLVGTHDVIVIDPGPMDNAHLDAILAAAPRISHILVTHSHLDHSPLAAPLAKASGAPVCAFGPSGAGTSQVMQNIMASLPDLGGGEGVDPDFEPNRLLTDGDVIGSERPLNAHHTPGHFGNHMTFETQSVVFSGDLVMGWASTLISPPHGDLTDFMTSCRALRQRRPTLLLPAHGDVVKDPIARIDWLIAHRMQRQSQILAQLGHAPATAQDLTRAIYADVAQHLWPAAQRNVIAHLIDLVTQSEILCDGPLHPDAQFYRL